MGTMTQFFGDSISIIFDDSISVDHYISFRNGLTVTQKSTKI